MIAFADVGPAHETSQQVRRTGSFELPCAADAAFPLFSPDGERDWVKGWTPVPLFPEKIEFVPDTVFREGSGSEEAVWTILDADWKTHRAEYVRLAALSHAARIVVKVEALESARCRVVVSYTVTAFGERGEDYLAAFSEGAYAEKMLDWQKQIIAHLASRKLKKTSGQP
jgi:hypothetical protein